MEDPENRKTVEDLERKDGRERILMDMRSSRREFEDLVREPKCLELGSDKHQIVQGRDVIVELRRDVVHRLRDTNKKE